MKFMTNTLKVASTLTMVALLFVGVQPINAQITDEGHAEKAVWSGYWWPTARQQIVSPLKKYDKLTGAKSAAYYQKENPAQGAAGWEGLCHAWSAASVTEIEPTTPIKIERMEVGVGDQKAWLTLCHDDDVANFYGDRFGDGAGSEDPQDIRPDELWTTLRSHLRERKIPVVADIACGAEVWNYPIYAYRVQISPVDGSLHRGTFEIWLADDAVPADFVGIKKAYKKYMFEVDVRNGSIVMGSGKWIENSVNDHPDFIWVPYVVQTSNPEMNYEKVCQLLGRNQAEFPDAPQDDEREEPAPGSNDSSNEGTDNNGGNSNENADNGDNPNDGTENNGDNPNPNENADNDGAENNVDETRNDAARQERLRKFVDSLESCKTGFFFSLAPKGLQREFVVGDVLTFDIIAESDGYLTVFSVNPNGRVEILYPAFGVDGRWTSNSDITNIPQENAPMQWQATEPIGSTRMIAVLSTTPLNFDVAHDESIAEIAEDSIEKVEKPGVDGKPANKILGWTDTTIYVGKNNEPDKIGVKHELNKGKKQ